MHRISRAVFAVVAAAVVSVGLAGCAGAREKVVPYTTESVTLEQGETLVVDFGEINPSVGDAWVIVQEPDSGVLESGVQESKYLGEEGMAGAPSEVSYSFAPAGPGATVIEFEYQFRGAVPDDEADQRTAEISVTVE